jgi:hypothetical protein
VVGGWRCTVPPLETAGCIDASRFVFSQTALLFPPIALGDVLALPAWMGTGVFLEGLWLERGLSTIDGSARSRSAC